MAKDRPDQVHHIKLPLALSPRSILEQTGVFKRSSLIRNLKKKRFYLLLMVGRLKMPDVVKVSVPLCCAFRSSIICDIW